jgi:hypothetical protein
VTPEQDRNPLPDCAQDGHRPRKEEIRREFGQRVVRRLLDLAGTSLRGFEERYGIDHSRVSYYKNGHRMPPLEFMEALVREARTLGGLTAEDAREAFRAYRTALAQLSTPGGSDQTSLLLRVYDLTQELNELGTKLETVQAGEAQARSELEKLQKAGAGVGRIDIGRQLELRQHHEELAEMHTGLVEQRTLVTKELKRCQSRILELQRQETPDSASADPTLILPSGAAPQRPTGRRRTVSLAVVAAVIGAFTAVGVALGLQTVRPFAPLDSSDGKPSPSASQPATPISASAFPKTPPSPSNTTKPPAPSKTAKPSTPVPSNTSPSTVPDPIGGGDGANGGSGDGSASSSGGAPPNGGFWGGTSSDPPASASPSPSDDSSGGLLSGGNSSGGGDSSGGPTIGGSDGG